MSAIDFSPAENPGELWAITSYFNPVGYWRRLANYKLFRERLNIPLVAVELAYGPNFELNDDDAEILIQLRSQDIMWQKERLLNVALRALPKKCKKVVWVDCDIIFERRDWPEQVCRLLDRFVIVQSFSHAHYVPRDCKPEEIRLSNAEIVRPSLAYGVASGLPARTCFGEDSERGYGTFAPGFSWAMRRDVIDDLRFYDACILGGGNRAMAGALYGCSDHIFDYYEMGEPAKTRYLTWAQRIRDATAGQAGFVDCNLFHLWHGTIKNRRWQDRYEKLKQFSLDLSEDIAIDTSGCWRWNTDKKAMHEYVRDYFASRREDG